MTLLGDTLTTLGILAATSLAAVFIWELFLERDPARASAKTSRRAVGVASGGISVAGAAAMVGTEVVLQLPELLIALVGIGSIWAGVSWEMFAATALITYLVAETANGGPPA